MTSTGQVYPLRCGTSLVVVPQPASAPTGWIRRLARGSNLSPSLQQTILVHEMKASRLTRGSVALPRLPSEGVAIIYVDLAGAVTARSGSNRPVRRRALDAARRLVSNTVLGRKQQLRRVKDRGQRTAR